MRKIVIDPVTRLEGHLKVMVNIDGGKVVNAEVAGTLYRGFETILVDRDPRDAILITQRICGVCPADHATAAALAYGAFPLDNSGEKMLFNRGIYLNGEIQSVDAARIREDVSHAWYRDSSAGDPALIHTEAQVGKQGAYSWVKAPRYDGKVCEVGPLARMWLSGHYRNGISAMDRIVARMEEAKVMANALAGWLDELDMDGECLADVTIPDQGMGSGMTEAARGALGHWVAVKNGKIERYEAVVPTTWNASPRDSNGQSGPIEAALKGIDVPDVDNPLPVIRVIHSFDPCLACAVHLMEPGKPMKEFTI